MVIKFSLLILMIVSNQFLFSQEMCPPSNLLSSSGDRSISLSWRHVNDSSSDENIIFRVFSRIMKSLVQQLLLMKLIMVEADGFVVQMAIFIVGNGPDCDLNPNGVGVRSYRNLGWADICQ